MRCSRPPATSAGVDADVTPHEDTLLAEVAVRFG